MANSNLRGALLGLAAMGLYCLYDIAIKFLGDRISPVQVLFCAGLVFVPLILAQIIWSGNHDLRPKAPAWTAARVAAALFNGIVGAYAFSVLPLAECYAVFFLMPLMITLLAVPVLGEKMDGPRSAAIAAGFCGVILALEPGGASSFGLGHIAAFSAATLGALNYVILRKTSPIETPGVLLLYPAGAQLIATGLAMPSLWVTMTAANWAVTTFMGLAVFVGGLLIIEAYRAARAIVVAPMQYSQIIWSTILGYVLFNEVMTTNMVIGILVIIGAGLFILTRQDHQPQS